MTTNRRLALVLSGGGIRGAAHIGAIRALEEAGVRPDLIVGTSIGAAAGAAWAAGHSPAAMSAMLRGIRWPRLTHLSLRHHLSLLRITPIDAFVREAIEPRTFAELGIPFAAVATDILTGERVVLTDGPVADAIRASSALPGFFPPIARDGKLLVDGGVVDNLPVGAARELGAEYVIAVDVLPAPREKRQPRHAIDMLMLVSDIRCRRTHPDPRTVECYVAPDIAEMSWSRLSEVGPLETRGYEAMTRELERRRGELGI